MRALFHPFLPNGPCGDPVVWVDLLDEGRSVLLDLGDLGRLPNRKLLRVDRVVVTHTHMDHFVGFDRLLRLSLSRTTELAITGPRGFIQQVTGRIASYTWNLIESYPVQLRIEEVDDGRLSACRFRGAGGLRPEPLPTRSLDGPVHLHPAFSLSVDVVDHGGLPVLAARLAEAERLSVDKDRLLQLGLMPGPWLHDLKQAVRRGPAAGERLAAQTGDGATRDVEVAAIAAEVLRRGRGTRLLYATDFSATPANADTLVRLGDGPDLFICEATFLDADRDLARQRGHLTARQAGQLARQAGARRLAPVHFSPRYGGDVDPLIDEAAAAFGGEVVRLPEQPVEPTPRSEDPA